MHHDGNDSSLLQRLLAEFREQGRTSGPTMLGMLLYKVPWLLSLRFVGNIGSHELAAAALATTLCNVTGMSLSVGLSSAMTTLTGQAKGHLAAQVQRQTRINNGHEQNSFHSHPREHIHYGNSEMYEQDEHKAMPLLPLTYLYRGIFIQLMLVLPVGFWWIRGIKPMLIYLGQGDVLSTMTEQYLRILTPGLWSYSINWTLTCWLQAIEMADVPVYAAAVGLVFHVPFNLLFIHVFGWGYLGCAVATVIFQVIQPILLFAYLFGTDHGIARVLTATAASGAGRTRLTFWKEAKEAMYSIQGIGQYLGLAIPGIVIISEWWASEISIFLSGRLSPYPALALDGMTIYQSINTFCFMFPVGCGVAGSTRVGYFLGSGDIHRAEFAAKVSVLSAAILSALMGSILYFTPHTLFPSFFSPDQDVILEASRTISLLSVYVFADGIQSALNGIIKGCGRQCITMPVVVFAYWVVGVPLAYYVAFSRHRGFMCTDDYFCGITGLVTGMTTGTWVHMLLLAIIVVCSTNWKVEAQRAKARLTTENDLDNGSSSFRKDEVNGGETMPLMSIKQ